MPVLSLSDFLWSLLIIFFMVTYFMMLFHVIVDIFRRKDTSGFTKAIWLLFLLIIPLFGLLAYLIVNGQEMGARDVGAAQESQAQFDDYVRSVSGGSAAEIESAKRLLDSGAIDQSEFDRLKAKALAG
jgi:predicted PurR-regulated permease PerM